MSTTNEKGKVIAIEKKTSAKEPIKTGTEQQQSISEILEQQLKEIKRKKKLADNRTVFLTKKEQLEELLKELKNQAVEGVFQSNNFSLNFKYGQSYNATTEFSISNPEMLLKFVVFLTAEIDNAIEKIEKELLFNLA